MNLFGILKSVFAWRKVEKVIHECSTVSPMSYNRYSCGCIYRAPDEEQCTDLDEIETRNESLLVILKNGSEHRLEHDAKIARKAISRGIYQYRVAKVIHKTRFIDKPCECFECRAMHEVNPVIPVLDLSHGISAYNKVCSIQNQIKRIMEIISHPEWELAATDNNYHIGDIGISFKARPRISWKDDMNSMVSESTTQRHRYGEFGESSLFSDKIKVISRDILDLNNRNLKGCYAEHFACPKEIYAVWIKKEYLDSINTMENEMLYDFCRNHKFLLEIIG